MAMRYRVIETSGRSKRPEMESVHSTNGDVLSKKIRRQMEWTNPEQAAAYAEGMNRMRKHLGKRYEVDPINESAEAPKM